MKPHQIIFSSENLNLYIIDISLTLINSNQMFWRKKKKKINDKAFFSSKSEPKHLKLRDLGNIYEHAYNSGSIRKSPL